MCGHFEKSSQFDTIVVHHIFYIIWKGLQQYLNQFLPLKNNIIWKWVDIAKLRKLGHFGDEFNQECRDLVKLVGISTTSLKQAGVVR